MSYFINDIVTYSDKGFEKLDLSFFSSENNLSVENTESDYLQGKGLRYIPRSVKLSYNTVAKLMDNEYYSSMRKKIGLYSTNGTCSLDSELDFKMESLLYGSNRANPAKAPFTLNCALAGWIAIREQLNNSVLSLNCGQCGIFSALSLSELDFYEDKSSLTIILGANFIGDVYEKYNISSSLKKEVAVALLTSPNKLENSIIEVFETKVMQYSNTTMDKIITSKSEHLFIEGDKDLDINDTYDISFIYNTSTQLSYFPFIINNILSMNRVKRGDICEYITADKKGSIGYIKFRVI